MVSRVRTAPGVVEQVTVRCDVLEGLAPGDPPVVMPWYLKSTGAARQCFGRKKDGRLREWLRDATPGHQHTRRYLARRLVWLDCLTREGRPR